MGKTKRQNTSPESSDRKLIHELKSIVRHQQKEIAKLRKELQVRDDVSEDYKELLNSSTEPVDNRPYGKRCPKCDTAIDTIPLGKFNLLRCQKCDWRVRQKEE